MGVLELGFMHPGKTWKNWDPSQFDHDRENRLEILS